jgi:hypothetical protein
MMTYNATPHSSTKFSSFYLLHGRETVLPASENLRAKLPPEIGDTEIGPRLENLKSSLQLAYKIARANTRNAHVSNKKFYDRKATSREFKEGDPVYLFNPARKPGTSKKLWYPWRGPSYIMAQLAN